MDIEKQLADALYRYEHAVDAMKATHESDDPHASTLARLEYDRATEVLKTWSQPEYLRQLLDAFAAHRQQEARNVRRAELLAGINAAYSIIDRARAELAELDKKE